MLFKKELKKGKNLKKLMHVFLSTALTFAFIPVDSYAMSGEQTDITQFKSEVIEEIEPGQVFTSGTYVIKDDIEVIQKDIGRNGIEIKGKVKFILENDCMLKIVAGDGKGVVGGGAGICVPKGNRFAVTGKGTLDVKGGNEASGESGGRGGAAKNEINGWLQNDYVITGGSGYGGNGGGGGGAGIGTPGGKGGLGGDSVQGDRYIMTRHIPGTSPEAQLDGKAGEPGFGADPAGTVILGDDVICNIEGGSTTPDRISGGSEGDSSYYKGWFTRFYGAGGAGGGAGGSGFDGASIGSGGAGGAGGGSGGVGHLWTNDRRPLGFGGGGGAGYGNNIVTCGGFTLGAECYDGAIAAKNGENGSIVGSGKGGSGCEYFLNNLFWSGKGGDGGQAVESSFAGDGGQLYSNRMINTEPKENQNNGTNRFAGRGAENIKITEDMSSYINF